MRMKQTKTINRVDKVYEYLKDKDSFTTNDIIQLLDIHRSSVLHLLSIVESRHPIQFEKRFSGGQNNNVCVYQVERLC